MFQGRPRNRYWLPMMPFTFTPLPPVRRKSNSLGVSDCAICASPDWTAAIRFASSGTLRKSTRSIAGLPR